jgi:ribose transport system ATP-binding protein
VKDPNSAIGLGIGYLSDDRIGESIIPDLSIRMNVSIASLKKLTRFLGLMNQKREKQEVLQLNDQLRVRRSNDEQRITELSGGNQQKVMIGRWLFTGSRFLVFNEPTQGIDVLAKSEVIQLLSEFAAAGNSVLILTTNDEEFLPIASRVLVMQHGKIVAELRGGQITHEAVVDAMILRLISHGSNHTIRGETA